MRFWISKIFKFFTRKKKIFGVKKIFAAKSKSIVAILR